VVYLRPQSHWSDEMVHGRGTGKLQSGGNILNTSGRDSRFPRYIIYPLPNKAPNSAPTATAPPSSWVDRHAAIPYSLLVAEVVGSGGQNLDVKCVPRYMRAQVL